MNSITIKNTGYYSRVNNTKVVLLKEGEVLEVVEEVGPLLANPKYPRWIYNGFICKEDAGRVFVEKENIL